MGELSQQSERVLQARNVKGFELGTRNEVEHAKEAKQFQTQKQDLIPSI
jgi:hypothetical protein